jgi:hypothetical protein
VALKCVGLSPLGLRIEQSWLRIRGTYKFAPLLARIAFKDGHPGTDSTKHPGSAIACRLVIPPDLTVARTAYARTSRLRIGTHRH